MAIFRFSKYLTNSGNVSIEKIFWGKYALNKSTLINKDK